MSSNGKVTGSVTVTLFDFVKYKETFNPTAGLVIVELVSYINYIQNTQQLTRLFTKNWCNNINKNKA